MLGTLTQLVIGIVLLVEGVFSIQERPHTAWLRNGATAVVRTLVSDDYEVPGLTVGIALIVLAAFALFNAFMIFGAQYKFWVV